jgi:AraC family transcriptional regulator, transcriptional activator of pobA
LKKEGLVYILFGVNPLTCLMRATSACFFEPYIDSGGIDEIGRYKWDPAPDFPFEINLISYSRQQGERTLVWHEYLELFIPLGGHCRLRVGDSVLSLWPGDVLLMDNLKMHCVLDFPKPQLRAIVIRFLPAFIYSFGSISIDHLFCLPFYHQIEGQPRVLRGTDAATARVNAALSRLVECYFDKADVPYSQAGTKVFFLEVLYHIARQVRVSEVLHSEYLRQQQRALRLRKLFDYTNQHSAERITVAQAAAIAGMSLNAFLGAFKLVTGLTWVQYLNQVRLANGAHLLRETCLPIAEIADRVGYADQSYFDRRFKERFGQAPLHFRMSAQLKSHRPAKAQDEKVQKKDGNPPSHPPAKRLL